VISRLAQILDPDIGLISPEEVAYIIIEPILGEGGYDIANPEFIREVAEIAHREGIPLIVDEIQTGLGRTGRWWAVEHFGVVPDIITSAKALRVGATIGKSTLFPREERRISSTWGEGNAISSAVGYQIIQTIQEEDLLKNAEEMGNCFLSGLRQLQSRFPVIHDVRGLGLMDAISVETDDLRNRVIRSALQKGLLVTSCGFESIRFLPPLNVTQREIDIALNILEDVFSEVVT